MNRNLATSSPRRRIGLVLASAVVGCALLVGADGALAAPADGGVLKANPKRVNFGTKQVGTFTVKNSTITNTGSTELLVQTVADRMPDQMLGTTTRAIVVSQPAPSERAASESVFRSIADRAASIARYANGSTRTT